MISDPYELLGVARDATPEALKSAWRRAALATHPDRHPDDPEAETRFKAVQAAYEILSDPVRRRQHQEEAARPTYTCPSCGSTQPSGGLCWPCRERLCMETRRAADEARFAAQRRRSYHQEQACLEATFGEGSFWDRSGLPRGVPESFYYRRKP